MYRKTTTYNHSVKDPGHIATMQKQGLARDASWAQAVATDCHVLYKQMKTWGLGYDYLSPHETGNCTPSCAQGS